MFKFKAEKQTHLAHKTCLHNALRAFGGEGEANEAKQSNHAHQALCSVEARLRRCNRQRPDRSHQPVREQRSGGVSANG